MAVLTCSIQYLILQVCVCVVPCSPRKAHLQDFREAARKHRELAHTQAVRPAPAEPLFQSPDSACLSSTPSKLHPKPVPCSTLETQGRPGSPLPPACTGTAGWEAWGCWSGSCPSAHDWMWKSGPTTAGTGGRWAERDSTEKKREGDSKLCLSRACCRHARLWWPLCR